MDLAEKMLEKLRLLIRQLKWGRPETTQGLLGFGILSGGWLLWKSGLFAELLPDERWVLAPFVLFGGGLLLLSFTRLWRLISRPLDIQEVEGPLARGASAFTPEDGEIFKKLGRQEELRRLRDWILDDQVPVVVVMGESGVGKTSLLRAGLQNLEGVEVAYWEAVASDPGRKLRHAVEAQLETRLEGLVSGVVLVDQAEQLGTDREVFELLESHLLKDPPYGVTWILAMRREYWPDWTEWSVTELPAVARQRVEILPVRHFSPERAEEIFSILADEVGLVVREEVRGEVIGSITEDGRVSPVDLAIALQVLVRHPRYAEDPRLLLSIGGHSAMLTSYLEGELEPYDEGTRGEICRALLELIDLETDRRKADGVSVEGLEEVASPTSDALFSHVLDRLSSRSVRVLERLEEGQLRLVHERFIPAIRRLAGAVLTTAEKASRLLARRYLQWAGDGEAKRFLLGGAELREVERELPRIQWGKNREGKVRFFERSLWRRRVWRQGAAVGLGILLLGLGLTTRWQQENAIRNEMRAWGPEGLYDALPRITHLSIEEALVPELRWLYRAEELTALDLRPVLVKSLTELPQELTKLENISLDLDESQIIKLEGIPEKISQLSLRLYRSKITSLEGIPKDISKISLDLYESHITTLVGIPENISQLSLKLPPINYIKISEGIPESLSEFSLNLSHSEIETLEGIPEDISQLSLDLSFSEIETLEGIPEDISQLSLDLSFSEIETLDGIPENIPQLSLYLSGAQIAILEGISDNISQLSLNLSFSEIETLDGIPDNISQLTLDLTYSQVTTLKGIPKDISQLTLDLSNSQVTTLKGIPKNISQLTLDLSDSQVTTLKGIPKNISHLSLDLSRSQVTTLKGIPENISQLSLNLYHSQIKTLDGIPENISHLSLNLGQSQITTLKGIPENISQLTLDLSNSQVTTLKGIPENISRLSLDLSDSQVTTLDGIPENISRLSLDLYDSQVTTLDGIPKNVLELELELYDSRITSLEGIPEHTWITKLVL